MQRNRSWASTHKGASISESKYKLSPNRRGNFKLFMMFLFTEMISTNKSSKWASTKKQMFPGFSLFRVRFETLRIERKSPGRSRAKLINWNPQQRAKKQSFPLKRKAFSSKRSHKESVMDPFSFSLLGHRQDVTMLSNSAMKRSRKYVIKHLRMRSSSYWWQSRRLNASQNTREEEKLLTHWSSHEKSLLCLSTKQTAFHKISWIETWSFEHVCFESELMDYTSSSVALETMSCLVTKLWISRE